MSKDPHDPRQFRKWVSFNADGTVAAEHEFAVGVEQPLPVAVDVTHLVPADLSAITVDPALVQALTEAVETLTVAKDALTSATDAHEVATHRLAVAVNASAKTPKEQPNADAKPS